MSRPTYRGHSADDLTGPAAGLYQAMRTMGVSEAGALREAVDTHLPPDGFDVEVRVLTSMGGFDEARAQRHVADRHGHGSIAEARRVLAERASGDADDGPPTTATVVRETTTTSTAPTATRTDGTVSDEFRRRVEEAEDRGLTLDQALAEAHRWRTEQRDACSRERRRLRETTTTTPAATGPTTPPASSAPPAAPDDGALRDVNGTRALSIFATTEEA